MRKSGIAKNFGINGPNPQLLGLLRELEFNREVSGEISKHLRRARYPLWVEQLAWTRGYSHFFIREMLSNMITIGFSSLGTYATQTPKR